MREMVIDYDSVTETALLYSVDYDGGVGTLVPAEIADAPALVSSADMVEVRSLLGLYQLVDETDFIYPTRHMTFTLPEGGDKCTNVYGVTGALRDRYIRRCIGVEMGQHAPAPEDDNRLCIIPKCLIPGDVDCKLTDEESESIMVALTAVLPDHLMVTDICLLGREPYIILDTCSEQARILALYMAGEEGKQPANFASRLREVAKESILDCARANLRALAEREDYTNDKAKELIRACNG